MSQAEPGMEGGERQSGANETLSALAAALSRLWSMGAGSLKGSAGLANSGPTAAAAAPSEPFIQTTAALRELARAALGELSGEQGHSTDRLTAEDAGALLIRAYLIAAVSGLRYIRRMTQTCGMHQSNILRLLLSKTADAGTSDDDRRILAEQIRTCLREIGDLSAQEARAFQAELEELAEEVAGAALGSQPTDDRRRWRAKP